MERFRCQSRCLGQRETLDPLVHREFQAETAETANKGQQVPQGHKVLLVLLVHKARRVLKATRVTRETKVTQEAHLPTSCLST